MTLEEIKEEVVTLPKAQRLEVARLLKTLDPEEDLDSVIGRRMKAMDEGHYITLEDFKKLAGIEND